SLMRDRMGEKPLYLGFVAGNFVFASELKALTAIPGFNNEPDRRALSLLVRHNYIPAPFSIYSAISKLEPGSWVQLSQEQCRHGSLPVSLRYWSAQDVARDASQDMSSFGSDNEAVDALEAVLSSAVKGQMISDVALGAFLSG